MSKIIYVLMPLFLINAYASTTAITTVKAAKETTAVTAKPYKNSPYFYCCIKVLSPLQKLLLGLLKQPLVDMDSADIEALCKVVSGHPVPPTGYTLTDGKTISKIEDFYQYITPMVKGTMDQVCSSKLPSTPSVLLSKGN